MPTDNRPRKVNLDDVDELEGVGEGEVEGFDQDVDFENITGVVEPGEYLMKNASYDLKMSKSSGRPMITLRATIMSGKHEGLSIFQDYSWAEGRAQVRSKKAFIGMGLPRDFRGSLRSMAIALVGDPEQGTQPLEYYAIIDVEQSDGINERTQQPYDPRNRIVSTSETPQTTG